jgi:hypothetical protein
LTEKLANGSVVTVKLGNEAVTGGKVAPNAIDSSKILDGSILSDDLGNQAVTGGKVAPNAIDSSKILDGSILSDDLGNQQVTSEKIADAAINAEKLAANSVDSANVIDNSLTGDDIDESTLAVPAAGFAPLPAASVRLGQVQAIPSSANEFTALNTTGVLLNVGNMHSSANPTRLTAPINGVYMITASTGFLPNAAGTRELRIIRNGQAPGQGTLVGQKGPANGDILSVAVVRKLNAGEFVEAKVRQDSGGDLGALPAVTDFAIAWVSPG